MKTLTVNTLPGVEIPLWTKLEPYQNPKPYAAYIRKNVMAKHTEKISYFFMAILRPSSKAIAYLKKNLSSYILELLFPGNLNKNMISFAYFLMLTICPQKADTVLILESVSSAMAPAAAYFSCSLADERAANLK